MVASAHWFEHQTPRSRPSRAVWFGVGFAVGLGAAAALVTSDRAYQATGRARERIAASLHAYGSGTRAHVAAPLPPPSAPAASVQPAPAPAPAPRDAEPTAFIGPPAPEPSASAKPRDRHGPRGFVTVVCLPACDEVRDGGRRLGSSPVFKRALAVGTHHLTLITNDPPISRRVDVEVTEGEVASVREEMIP